MKLITLNLWGGRVREPLKAFLKKQKDSADIFCFQEMYHQAEGKFGKAEWVDTGSDMHLFANVSAILDAHSGYYRPHFMDFWGLAIFIRKNLPVLAEGDAFVHHAASAEEASTGATSKNVQHVLMEIAGVPVNIVTVHGLWNGKGKRDTEPRIRQSEKIVEFMQTLKGEIILCGDFNLRPDTESVHMIERFGMRNLVTENGVTSTRTSLYPKSEKYADYIFVTPGIEVQKFEVMPDEVSDHAALLLEFDIPRT